MFLLGSGRGLARETRCFYFSLLLSLHHFKKRLMRNIYLSTLLHPLLTLLLLLPKLHLTSTIASIHVLSNIFLHGRQGARGNNTTQAHTLNLGSKHLSRQ